MEKMALPETPPMQKKGVRYTGREGVAGGEQKGELLFSVFPFPSSPSHYSVDKEAQYQWVPANSAEKGRKLI